MAKWVRNLHTPYTPDGGGCTHIAMLHVELMLVAGWTVDSSVGTAWTDALNLKINRPAGVNGFEVDAGESMVIYDPLGQFTQAMVDNEHMISLLASNDQNRSAWRITEFIDANHVKVDADGFSPYGWATETQMAGRVVTFAGAYLSALDEIVMNAPAPSRMQVRIQYVSTSSVLMFLRPMGQPRTGVGASGDTIDATGTPNIVLTVAAGKFNKHMPGTNITISDAEDPNNNGTFPITAVSPVTGVTYTNALGSSESFDGDSYSVAGIATETPAAGFEVGDNYNNRFRAHLYSGDDGSYFMYARNQDNDYDLAIFTEIEETVSEDIDRGFGVASHTAGIATPFSWTPYMLDGAVSPASARGYLSFIIEDETTDIDTDCMNLRFNWRLLNKGPGGTPMWKPNVYVGGSNQCRRGRFPHLRFGNTSFQSFRPIDAAGLWLHWDHGIMYPRNGPYDPLPIAPDAS